MTGLRRRKMINLGKAREWTLLTVHSETPILIFSYDIHHNVTTNSEVKASLVERFNQTLKEKLFKYLTYKNTKKYIDILPDLLSSFHRSIQMKPIEVNKTNKDVVWHTLYGQIFSSPVRFKFHVGDHVRISKSKSLPNWSIDIFSILERLPRYHPCIA